MRVPAALAIAIISPTCAIAFAQEVFSGGVGIPHYPRLPLEQRIASSKSTSVIVKLWESDGRCRLKVGSLAEVGLDLAGPCDIHTSGATSGFTPWVSFGPAAKGPADFTFEIVGELKYYPKVRGECGSTWQRATIKFSSGPVRAEALPRLELSPAVTAASSNQTVRCPRAYVDIK